MYPPHISSILLPVTSHLLTGLLLSPVLELPVFLQSRLLNANLDTVPAAPADRDSARAQNLPDIEIMPVSPPPPLPLTPLN